MNKFDTKNREIDEEERKARAAKAVSSLRTIYSELMELPHDKAKVIAARAIRTFLNTEDTSTYKVFIGETEQKIIVRVR